MSQRFTEAELAAEWWKAEYITERLYRVNDDRCEVERLRAVTFERFALLPHAHAEFPGLATCTCGHLIGGHLYQTGQCEVITCGCPMYDER